MKKTIVHQIEITNEGHIQVRMQKQIIDGDTVHVLGYHRTSVVVGGDVDAQMLAVNVHLAMLGLGTVAPGEIDEVKKYAEIAFTPEKVEAFRALQEAAASDITSE